MAKFTFDRGTTKIFSVRYRGITKALEKLPHERLSTASFVFDVLMLRGKSLIDEPLSKRREILQEKIVSNLADPVRFSTDLDASLPDLIQSVKAARLEGLVAKRRDSAYEPDERSGAWQRCASIKVRSW
jgi:ATP-dependent DNA ligase